MNGLSLSLAYVRHKAAATTLHIVTFAAGVAMIVALLLVDAQFQNSFSRNLHGIDLVAGGKGSPMQLILSAVFHIDIPTGNIPLEEAETLAKNPLVKSTIPIALGDNYNGYRIVGTNADYIAHYHGTFASGRMFAAPMEAVAGSEVAQTNTLKPGDSVVGAHGLVNSDDLHSDFPYSIVGILAPTGTVLDRLLLTPVASVWKVHEHPDPDDTQEMRHAQEHPGKEITALLITYKTPYAAVTLPRMVDKSTSMQAASPAIEMARLTRMMGVGAGTLRAIGWFLVALAGAGMFVGLYNAMDERRYDLALMRSFGASPAKLFGLIVTEGAAMALASVALGIGLGHAAVAVFGSWLAAENHVHVSGLVFLPQELWLLPAGLVIGVVSAVLPAFSGISYRHI